MLAYYATLSGVPKSKSITIKRDRASGKVLRG